MVIYTADAIVVPNVNRFHQKVNEEFALRPVTQILVYITLAFGSKVTGISMF